MVDTLAYGRRPAMRGGPDRDPAAREALEACPGRMLAHAFDLRDTGLNRDLMRAWGPIYGVWEGYAADDEIRFAGSSGGAASALALHCIERAGFHGLLHITARADAPYLNRTVLSTTRAEILAATGSRYAPASPCDGLQMIEDAASPCVFIGKPCDVAGAAAAARLRPRLAQKLGLTIAIFCAGTPTTAGTLALLRAMGIADPASVESVRYRGNGWPGRFVVRYRDAAGQAVEASRSYEESWGLLANHKQWRCNICPDHTGEFADVAVGDPWHRKIGPGEAGRSLVLARTPRGRRFVEAAIASGDLVLEPASPGILPASQPNLLHARGAVWGRITALRLAGVPVPTFERLPMFGTWLTGLSLREKLQSTIGAIARIGRRRLREPHPVVPFVPPAAGSSRQRSAPSFPGCAAPR
jgi:coenzyme F420 hydrogenase subunit beta